MPIIIVCPGCGVQAKAHDNAAGKRMRCPKCKAIMIVPGIATGLQSEEEEELPRRRHDDQDDRHRRDDQQDGRKRGFACPFCGSDYRPRSHNKMSSGGWVLMSVMGALGILSGCIMGLVCFPFGFVLWGIALFGLPGLAMTEERKYCVECGMRID